MAIDGGGGQRWELMTVDGDSRCGWWLAAVTAGVNE